MKIENMKWVSDFSIKGKVFLIVMFFVLISLLLTAMLYLQGSISDGVRVYVRGEGLWAKAQKDAALYLERYTYTRLESDYRAFESAVAVNLGDRKAREALCEIPPQRLKALQGFLEGGNDSEDVDTLIWFFLNFRVVSYMHDAIEIWKAGDGKIAELIALGKLIRREAEKPESAQEPIERLRMQLHTLNVELLQLENRFSAVLGEGARWVKRTVWLSSLGLLLLFMGTGIFISRQIIAGITRTEQALLASESRFRSLKGSDTIGIISWRMDGCIVEANRYYLDMLGYAQTDVAEGRVNWRDITPPQWYGSDARAVEELLRYGRCEPFEKELIRKDGHLVPVYVGGSMLEGDREHGIAYVMDLTERKKAEEQLQLASAVFSSSNEGILITDASMKIVSVNRAFQLMTGYDEGELLGKKPAVLRSGHTTKEQYLEILETLQRYGAWHGDIIDRRKSGELLPLRMSISSVENSEGVPTHYVAIASDISEHKAREEQLKHQAHHDHLTGLPNRVLLNDRIEEALQEAKRKSSRFAVLFFDLDRFKPVNDTFGHKVGDFVLQIVAERLQRSVRTTDTVMRLGGDEFVILLNDVEGRESVEEICRKISDLIALPMHIDQQEIDIGISAGFSVYPEDGECVKSLLDHADSAMYDVKQNGKKER